MTLKIKRIPSTNFLASVSLVTIGLLPCNPSIQRVANALGCSKRTLQRRLSDNDTDFSEILFKIRREKAHQMLKTSDIKLETIAIALGYSNPSSFCRAFLQWEGVSPGYYRKLRQRGDGPATPSSNLRAQAPSTNSLYFSDSRIAGPKRN